MQPKKTYISKASKMYGKPDSACSSAISSIKQNPKFARLLIFSINTMTSLVCPPNPKHRDNAHFVFNENGYLPLIDALKNHISNDTVLSAATKCLIGIVGEDKFLDEEKAKKFVEVGLVECLVNAIQHPAEKSSGTIKVMIQLLGLLGVNAANIPAIVEKGGMDICFNLAQKEDTKKGIVRQAIMTIEKMSNNPTGRAAIIKGSGIKHLIELFSKKPNEMAIISGGLRTISNLSKSKDGIALMKGDKNFMSTVVDVLEKHPDQKQIINLASNMLGKVATVEDLDQAIVGVRSGKTASMALLSSLVLVDEMMEEAVRKGIVEDLIVILQKNSESKETTSPDNFAVIKNCVTALGRIANVDYKQAQVIATQGGLEAIANACEIKDPELLRSCSDSLQKICLNEAAAQAAIKNKCIPKLMTSFNAFPKDEKLSESVVGFVSQMSADPVARDQLAESGCTSGLVARMKQFFENQKLQEQGLKALQHMSGNRIAAKAILEAGAVDHVAKLSRARPEWKKAGLNAVTMINNLSKDEENLPMLKKANATEIVVDILSGKAGKSAAGKMANIATAEGGEGAEGQEPVELLDDDVEDEAAAANEQNLSLKQEAELKEAAVAILSKISDPGEVNKIKGAVSEMSKIISKKSDEAQIANLESKLNTASCLVLLPGAGEELLKEDLHVSAGELAKRVTTLPTCDAKTPILNSLIKFYENAATLNTREATKGAYAEKKIGADTLNFYSSVLEKGDEPIPAALTIRSITKILANKANYPDFEKDGSILGCDKIGGKPVMDKIIEGTVKMMTKFPDNEEVQTRALELIEKAIEMSPSNVNLILKHGGTRQLIAKFEAQNFTSKKRAAQSLRILNQLADTPESLQLLSNQRALPAIMAYVASNRNEAEIQKEAAPVIEKLSKVQNTETANAFKQDIKAAVGAINTILADAENLENNIEAIADNLESIADFTMVDQNIKVLVEEGVPAQLLSMVNYESQLSEEDLAEKGTLTAHDRVMTSGLSSLKKLMANPDVKKSDLIKDLVQEELVESVAGIIINRPMNEEAITHALDVLNQLVSNPVVKADVIKRIIKSNLGPGLVNLMEQYKDNPVSVEVNKCLMTISQASPEIASKLGQKAFIKNLMKETRNILKGSDDSQESAQLAKQNLQTLQTLAKASENQEKLLDEGAVDIAVGVLRKTNNTKKSSSISTIQINTRHMPDSRLEDPNHVSPEELTEKALNVLNQLLSTPESVEQNVSSDDLIVILNSLESTDDKPTLLTALKIIKKATDITAIAEFLSENEAVDKVMGVLNRYPLDSEIKQIAGEVLSNLGAGQMVDQMSEQVIDIAESFDENNPELVESLTGATIYLSNLLATAPEEVAQSHSNLIKAVEKTIGKAGKDPQLLVAQCLLVQRIAQRADEKTQDELRNSDIIGAIAEKFLGENANEVMSVEAGQTVDIVLDTITAVTETKVNRARQLDIATGQVAKVVSLKDQEKFGNKFLANNGKAIDTMLKIMDPKPDQNGQNYNSDTVKKAIRAFNQMNKTSEPFAKEVSRKGGLKNMIDLFESLANKDKNAQKFARDPKTLKHLKETADFMAAQARVGGESATNAMKSEFVRTSLEVLKYLDVQENSTHPEKAHNKEQFELAQAQTDAFLSITDLVSALAESSADKGPLIDASTTSSLIEPLKKLNTIEPSLLNTEAEFPQKIDATMRALKSISKDPALVRSLFRGKGQTDILQTLTNLSAAVSEIEAQVDDEELGKMKEIVGSEAALDRAIESTLMLLDELTRQQKFAKELDLLNGESQAYQDLLTIAGQKMDNAIVSAEVLKISHNSLKTTPKDKVLENKEILEPVSDCAQAISDLYANIPSIQTIAEEVKQIVAEGEIKKAQAEEKKGGALAKAMLLANVVQAQVDQAGQSPTVKQAATKATAATVKPKKAAVDTASLNKSELLPTTEVISKLGAEDVAAAEALQKQRCDELIINPADEPTLVNLSEIDPSLDKVIEAQVFEVDNYLHDKGIARPLAVPKGSKIIPAMNGKCVIESGGKALTDSAGNSITLPAESKIVEVNQTNIVVGPGAEVLKGQSGKPIIVPKKSTIVIRNNGDLAVVDGNGKTVLGDSQQELIVPLGSKIVPVDEQNCVIINCPASLMTARTGIPIKASKGSVLKLLPTGGKLLLDKDGKEHRNPENSDEPLILPISSKLVEGVDGELFVATGGTDFLRDEDGKPVVVPVNSQIVQNSKGARIIVTPDKKVVTDRDNEPYVLPPISRITQDTNQRGLVLIESPSLLESAPGKPIAVPKKSQLAYHSSGNKVVLSPEGKQVKTEDGVPLLVSANSKVISGLGDKAYITQQGYDLVRNSEGEPVKVDQQSQAITNTSGKTLLTDSQGKAILNDSELPYQVTEPCKVVSISNEPKALFLTKSADVLTNAQGRAVRVPQGSRIVTGSKGEQTVTDGSGAPIMDEEQNPIIVSANSHIEYLPDEEGVVLSEGTTVLSGAAAGYADEPLVIPVGYDLLEDEEGDLVIVNPEEGELLPNAQGGKIAVPHGSKIIPIDEEQNIVIIPNLLQQRAPGVQSAALTANELLRANKGKPIALKKGAKLVELANGSKKVVNQNGEDMLGSDGLPIILPEGSKIVVSTDDIPIVIPEGTDILRDLDGSVVQVKDGANIVTDLECKSFLVEADGRAVIASDGMPISLPPASKIVKGQSGKANIVVGLSPEVYQVKNTAMTVPKNSKVVKLDNGRANIKDPSGQTIKGPDGEAMEFPGGIKIIEGPNNRDLVVFQGTDIIYNDEEKPLVVEEGTQILRDAEGNNILVTPAETIVTSSDGETPVVLPPGCKVMKTDTGELVVLSLTVDVATTKNGKAITVPLTAHIVKGQNGGQLVVDADGAEIKDADGSDIFLSSNSKLIEIPEHCHVIASQGSELLRGTDRKPFFIPNKAGITNHPLNGLPVVVEEDGTPVMAVDGQPLFVPAGSKIFTLPDQKSVLLTLGEMPLHATTKSVSALKGKGNALLTLPVGSKIITGAAGEQKVVDEKDNEIKDDDGNPLIVGPGSKLLEVDNQVIVVSEGCRLLAAEGKPVKVANSSRILKKQNGVGVVLLPDGNLLQDPADSTQTLSLPAESQICELPNSSFSIVLMPGVDVLKSKSGKAIVVPSNSTIVKAETGERLVVDAEGQPVNSDSGEPIIVNPATKIVAVEPDLEILVSHNADLLRGVDRMPLTFKQGTIAVPIGNAMKMIANPDGEPILHKDEPIIVPDSSELLSLPDDRVVVVTQGPLVVDPAKNASLMKKTALIHKLKEITQSDGVSGVNGGDSSNQGKEVIEETKEIIMIKRQDDDNAEEEKGGEETQQEEVQPEEEEEEFKFDGPIELDEAADTLEELTLKLQNGEASAKEETIIEKIIEEIDKSAENEDAATKVMQYGMMNSAVTLLGSKKASPAVKMGCISVIKKIADNPNTQDKLINDDNAMDMIWDCLKEKGDDRDSAMRNKVHLLAALGVVNGICGNDKASEKFKKRGGIGDCIDLMNEYEDDDQMMMCLNSVLSKMVNNNQDINDFAKAGGAAAIVKSLEKCENDLEMLIALTELVGRTGQSPQMQKQYAERGVFETIFRGSAKYPDVLRLNTNICFAFSSLVLNNPENGAKVVKSNTIQHMRKEAEKNIKEGKFMEHLSTMCNSLAFKNPENRKTLFSLGIHVTLTKILKEFAQNYDKNVIKQCLKAVGNLALHAPCAGGFVQEDFTPPICDFLHRHTQDSDIVKLALAVVGNLAIEDIDGSVNKMIDQGIVETILECCQAHELNTDLLINAIESLGNLVKTKEIAIRVTEKHAMEQVLQVIKSQDFSIGLMEKCTTVLSDLVSAPENAEKFVEIKGHEMINQIISSQKDENEIIFSSFKILSRISSEKNRCKIVVASGILDTILSAFEASSWDMDCIREMMSVISKLSQIEEGANFICEKGISLILETVKKNLEEEKLCYYTGVLLVYLLNLQSSVDAVIRDKGIEILNDLVSTYPTEEKIVLNGFRGLSSIALHSEEHRQLLLQNTCDKVVKRAMDDFGNEGNTKIKTEGDITYHNIITPHKSTLPEEVNINIGKKDSGPLVTKEIKNFLTSGKIIKLYKKDGTCKEMHMFLSNDLKEIIAKKIRGNEIKPQWRIAVHQIKTMTLGYDDKSGFAKAGGMFKKKPDPKTCLSIIGPMESEGLRALYVQANNEMDCKKWYDALSRVLQEFRQQFGKNKV